MAGRVAYVSVQEVVAGEATASHVFGIVEGLRRQGWDVTLLLPRYAASPPIAGRLLQTVNTAWRLGRQARCFDVIYVRGSIFALPIALAARVRSVPVVHELNGPPEEVFVTWPATRRAAGLVDLSFRLQMRWSAAAIGVTPNLATAAAAAGAPRTFTVPNGVDVDRFRPDLPRRDGLPARYAVFFGELAPWQGIDVLLDAIALPAWPQNLPLVVVGGGVLRPEIDAAARGGDVVYLGRLPQDDLARVVAGATVAVSPQNGAAGRAVSGVSPLKVFEAMAAGVPVVVTDLPGARDVVEEARCGRIVAAGDADAMARGVAAVVGDPDLAQLKERARVAAVEQHSWSVRAMATGSILDLVRRSVSS